MHRAWSVSDLSQGEFWGIMADLLSRQRGVVESMMRESMNITTPRPFQLEAIAYAVYGSLSESTRLLLVAKCGSGKSACPLGVLRMKRGVGITIVPYLSIGTGQASAATEQCPAIESIHVDELSPFAMKELIQQLGQMESRKVHKHTPPFFLAMAIPFQPARPLLCSLQDALLMLYISPQMVETNKALMDCVRDHLIKRGILSLMVRDECHRFPLDAPGFRVCFGQCKTLLFDLLVQSPQPVVSIDMTATLTKGLLADLVTTIGCKHDRTFWTDVSRRDVKLALSYAPSTIDGVKDFVKRHSVASEGRSVTVRTVVFSNHRTRVVNNIPNAIRKLLPPGETCDSLHGHQGSLMKGYTIAAWSAEPNHFKHTNPKVCACTSTGNCGVDSKHVGGVVREGPPPNVVDIPQELGRQRGLLPFEWDYEYKIILSVATLSRLILRIHRTDSILELRRQTKAMMEALELLVLPKGCVHKELELMFGNPDDEQTTSASLPCGTKCWVCNRSLTDEPKTVDRSAVVRSPHPACSPYCPIPPALLPQPTPHHHSVLSTHAFLTGQLLATKVSDVLYAHKEKVWPHQMINKKHCDRLVIQMIAAQILAFSVQLPDSSSSQSQGSVNLNWATADSPRTGLARDEEPRWHGIAAPTLSPTVTVTGPGGTNLMVNTDIGALASMQVKGTLDYTALAAQFAMQLQHRVQAACAQTGQAPQAR